jgi:glutaredoxin 3
MSIGGAAPSTTSPCSPARASSIAVAAPPPARFDHVASYMPPQPIPGAARLCAHVTLCCSHTGCMSSRVILFSTDSCTYCEHAKSLLSKRGVCFEEVNLSEHPELQAELTEVTGLASYPQIVVDGEPLGGLNELRAAEKNGVLASWSAT